MALSNIQPIVMGFRSPYTITGAWFSLLAIIHTDDLVHNFYWQNYWAQQRDRGGQWLEDFVVALSR